MQIIFCSLSEILACASMSAESWTCRPALCQGVSWSCRWQHIYVRRIKSAIIYLLQELLFFLLRLLTKQPGSNKIRSYDFIFAFGQFFAVGKVCLVKNNQLFIPTWSQLVANWKIFGCREAKSEGKCAYTFKAKRWSILIHMILRLSKDLWFSDKRVHYQLAV